MRLLFLKYDHDRNELSPMKLIACSIFLVLLNLAVVFTLPAFAQVDSSKLKILLAPKCKVWKDSADMHFMIRLINQSDSTIPVLDQVFDDVYAGKPSALNNLTFIVQRLEKGRYHPYRDRPDIDYLWYDERTATACLDSLARIRVPFIDLKPHDSLCLNYSFMFGRDYKKGKYRIKVDFKYSFSGRWGERVESHWVYFEVKNDLFRPSPRLLVTEKKSLFWGVAANAGTGYDCLPVKPLFSY